MHRAAKVVTTILFAIVFHQAQAQAVLQAPPRIEFGAWVDLQLDDDDLSEYHAEFPSSQPSGVEKNDTVHVRSFVPKKGTGPFPVVIVLHYWGANDQKIERSLAGDLARQGIASVLMTLPYHLERTPPGARSGEKAILPDPAHLVATMSQAVLDVRRTVDFIVSRPEFDATRIGIAGTSLGSIVSSISFAVEPRLKSASFMLGGADLAHILWNSSRVVKVREALRKKGYSEARLREELQDVEPLRFLPQRADKPAFVVGGKFDTVVPPDDTKKLIDALGTPSTLWLDTGHYGGVFVQRRILRLVSQFFAGQFGGKTFVPPKSVYAPTVRIVLQANTESSFQVGLGVDIWRSNARGDFFSTAIATPRGPQLFLGARLDKSLAIGAFATAKKVSPGIVWSFIL